MKKTIIICGLIAGLIVTAMMLFSVSGCYKNASYEGNMVLGYASMLIAFSLIFVGVKSYRDKYNGGVITFGKAFKIGFSIALIASTIYVVVWLIDYYCFMPDFYEKYSAHMVNKMRAAGASAAEIQKQVADAKSFGEKYKNPFFNALVTYGEILPMGLLVSLLAAFILKRRRKNDNLATVA